jgi:hypothetical protein
MPETITYTQTLSASGGPMMTNTVTFSAEAYDKLSFIIPPEGLKQLNLQASENQYIQAMYIRASKYGEVGYGLGESLFELTGPLMLVNIDWLNVMPFWTILYFANNSTTESITIDVLFVRTAIETQGGN